MQNFSAILLLSFEEASFSNYFEYFNPLTSFIL